MTKQEIFLEGIGDVLFVCDQRNKHLRLSINPTRGIRVSYPPKTAYSVLEKFIYQHQAQIKQAQAKYENLRHQPPTMIELEPAKKLLYERLELLADKYGFKYEKVSFRNQKTRWGSCSSQNNISLNIQIMLLPPELQDYILLHELLHTKIKNHSANYWNEFSSILPEARKFNAMMREHPLISVEII